MLITFACGQKIYQGEIVGMLAAAMGCVIMMLDPSAKRVGESHSNSSILIPDLINFLSSLFGAFYFLMNAKNVK